MTTSINDYLLYVVKQAINNQPVSKPSEDFDWKAFYRLARKQELSLFIASVIPKDYFPDEISKKINNLSKSSLQHILLLFNEFSRIEDELEKNKMRYMPLKGYYLRNLYPEVKMRSMSDIDLYYDIADRNALKSFMNSFGYTLDPASGNSDDYHKDSYYTYEFHYSLFFEGDEFSPDFSFVWDNSYVDDENRPYRYHMSDDDLYLHTICHMYKHLNVGGFGLRFIIDNYLQLKKSSLNFDYIDKKLEEFGIIDFKERINSLSYNLFEGELTQEQQLDIESILDNCLFGNHEVGLMVPYEEFLKTHSGGFLRLRFALSKLFPSKEFMYQHFPELNENHSLLGIYYIKRLFKKLSFGSKGRVKKNLKVLKNVKK